MPDGVRKTDMLLANSILSYILMAAVTLGILSVPSAIVYEHPQFLYSRWVREDLNV
jgi:hypothetical protein